MSVGCREERARAEKLCEPQQRQCPGKAEVERGGGRRRCTERRREGERDGEKMTWPVENRGKQTLGQIKGVGASGPAGSLLL